MKKLLLLATLAGCNNISGEPDEPDAGMPAESDAKPITPKPDADPGTLLGFDCTLPPDPIVETCANGGGVCVDGGAGNGQCRPWCYWPGTDDIRCEALNAEVFIYRGACVCVPR